MILNNSGTLKKREIAKIADILGIEKVIVK